MRSTLRIALGSIAIIAAGCGSSNINETLFSTASQDDSFESLTTTGRLHNDQGEYDQAIEKLEKANALNPHDEETARLLGFAYLGQAGLGLFEIVEKILDLNTSSTSSSNAADTLSNFSGLIGLTDAEFLLMGETNTGLDTDGNQNSIVEGLPVIRPYQLSGDNNPRTKVTTLVAITKMLQVICPFVDQSLKADDGSDRYANCEETSGRGSKSAETHFLFAIGHLLEAVAFNQVILYSKNDTSTSTTETTTTTNSVSGNLLKRAEALEKAPFSTPSEFTDYLAALSIIKQDFDSVFDTDNATSMLSATLDNIRIAVNSFGKISGIPSGVTSNLSEALDSLEKTAEQTQVGSGQEKTAQSGALKSQLDSAITTAIKTSGEKYIQEGQGTDEEIEQVCSQLSGILGSTDIPSQCS